MKNEEHKIQAAFFRQAGLLRQMYPGIELMFAIPNGGARDVVTGAKLKAEGVKRGIPDVFLPVARGGFYGLFIEFKTQKGRASPEQAEFMEAVKKRGYAAVVCRSAADGILSVVDYFSKPRS